MDFFKNPEIAPTTYNFCERGEDALLIVEELQRREGAVFTICANDAQNNQMWLVGNRPECMALAARFEGRMDENDAFAASAPTFAMAVCLAALKSINVKI